MLDVDRLGGAARAVRVTWAGGVIGRRIVAGDTAVPMRDAAQYPVSADLATAIEDAAHELAERVRVSERHDRTICTCGYVQRAAATTVK